MQQPEQITFQTFSLNPVVAKQFLTRTLRAFLSDNPQENEQNLDKLISTLFSIEAANIRVTFAELIDTIKDFPANLIEPQLKLKLLKNIALFSAKDITVLCEAFTKFNKCINELSGDINKLTPVVLLFALQFPSEYKEVLTDIEKLIQNKSKKTALEIIHILSSFMPRALNLIFNNDAQVIVTRKGERQASIPLCELIVELAEGQRRYLSIERLTTLFTQPLYLDLLTNNIILFEELHKLSEGIMTTINLLSTKGIEINGKLMALFLSLKSTTNVQATVQRYIKLAYTANFQFTSESCYLFIMITLTDLYDHKLSDEIKTSRALQIIKAIGTRPLIKISEQIVERSGYHPPQENLIVSLVRDLNKISSLTDAFLNDIKKMAEDFADQKISLAQFRNGITNKINEHPDVIAEQKKADALRNNLPSLVATAPIPRAVSIVRGTQYAAPAVAVPKVPVPVGTPAAVFAKPAPQTQAAHVPANASEAVRNQRNELLKTQKLVKLRALLANTTDLSLIDLANKQYSNDELDGLIIETKQLHYILEMKKRTLANQPGVQVANVAATKEVRTTIPSTIQPVSANPAEPTSDRHKRGAQGDPLGATKLVKTENPPPAAAALETFGLHRKRPHQEKLPDEELSGVESDISLIPSNVEHYATDAATEAETVIPHFDRDNSHKYQRGQ